MPKLSDHFAGRQPSPIRQAQIRALARPDRADLVIVNLAIGNVSLPMHPALTARLRALGGPDSPFADGVVKYSPTSGLDDARRAFLNVIASCGATTSDLSVLVTDGGSMAMELMVLGVSGPRSERPLLLLDPSYSNYSDMARRVGARTLAARRQLGPGSRYSLPDLEVLGRMIARERPSALVVIPADNPTGQFLDLEALASLARLAVEHDLWLVSDEAYRQLTYGAGGPSSIWLLDEARVPGIRGRRVSIETASKVFNACGLRVGALVTDHAEFGARALAEATANLCSNVLGQWVFGALAEVPANELAAWYERQRDYYRTLLRGTTEALRAAVPGMVVSEPEAALYSVLDFRGVPGRRGAPFDAADFARFTAERGAVDVDGARHTLLVAPLAGFQAGAPDPASSTQVRIAYVEPPDVMRRVPRLLAGLIEQYRAEA